MARNPLQPNDDPNLVNPLAPAWWPGQDALTTADAYQHTIATLRNWMQAQRAQASAQGYWNDQTGLPTQAGLMDAVKQYGGAMVAGTQAPGFRASTARRTRSMRSTPPRSAPARARRCMGMGCIRRTRKALRDRIGTNYRKGQSPTQ